MQGFDLLDPMNLELARATPAGWAWYAMRGDYLVARHLEIANDAICETVEAEGGKLMIEMPPRHGKSLLAAVALSGWNLGLRPSHRVAIATGTLTLAKTHGRSSRDFVREHGAAVFGIKINPERDAVTDWGVVDAKTGVPTGGGFRAYGLSTQFTGEGADLLILDDLVPDAEAADSPVIRESTWAWYESVATTRLQKGASTVAMTTRWHEDDVHGRIRARLAHEGWRIIRMPAISEGEGDPMGRREGEALWPWFRTIENLEQERMSKSPRWWNAMWQQRPTALEGGIWQETYWRERTYELEGAQDDPQLVLFDGYRVPLSNCVRFLTVDLATTEKETGDFTAIGAFALTPERPRRLVVLDMHRERMEAPKIDTAVKRMLSRWGARVAYYEEKGNQKWGAQYAKKAGIPARTIGTAKDCSIRISGDKVAVAHDAVPLASQGRLVVPVSAAWLAEWEHEMLIFPNGSNDDMEDSTAWACHIAQSFETSSLLAGAGSPREEDPEWVARTAEDRRRERDRRSSRRSQAGRAIPRGDALDEMGVNPP